MVSATRKPHRKTRTGCRQCKGRKVKCGEENPTCQNCINHALQCTYLLLPTSSTSARLSAPISNTPGSTHENTTVQSGVPESPRPINVPSGLSMLHLELLHNFTISTSLTLSADLILRTMWRVNVPRIAFSFDFVMHALLALSALHLARSPGKADFYESIALSLHQNGLRQATALLTHVNAEKCSALYIFTALSCIITLASPRKPENCLLFDGTGISLWLVHLRGTRSVLASADAALRLGPVGPTFIAGERRSKMRDAHLNDPTVEADQLDKLLQLIRENSKNEQELAIYANAIHELQGSFNVTYATEFQAYGSADVYIWLFRILDGYLELLNEQRQEAVAIFAFFCVILRRFDSPWYMNGWAAHILSRIYYLLDEQHRLWIQWPIEEIGLVLY